MKILVLSDSHGNGKIMANVVQKYKKTVDCVVFLGDCIRDCDAFVADFAKPIYMVAGNCDYASQLPEELLIELGGKKVMMTHGHMYRVKVGYDNIITAAVANGADICLFGHTHAPVYFVKNGITFLNPGSINLPRGCIGKSYAIIEIVGGAVLHKFIEVQQGRPLRSPGI